jgi:hypothetical protein
MGKITIPQKTIPKQVNRGDQFGDFWGTWNTDLVSNMGKVRVSARPLVHTASTDNALLSNPVAFVRSLSDTLSGSAMDSYFAVCNQKILKMTVASLTATMFQSDSLSSSPTTALSSLYSDAVDFNGNLVVSLKTTLARLVAGTWTADWYGSLTGSPTLTDSTPHPLCVGFTKELLIGNGNIIASILGTTPTPARITLSSEYEVQWIRSSSSAYWIGCRNKQGGEGRVFMWDGKSPYVVGEYKIGSDITFSGVIKNEIPYTVNGNGVLLAFNGGGFSEVDRFPIANERQKNKLDDGFNTTGRYPVNIHRNGIAIIDGEIHILLSAGLNNTNYTLLENMLSGIWCYTKETGLHHRYSIVKTSSSGGAFDYGSPKLFFAGALYPLNAGGNNLPGSPSLIERERSFFAGARLYSNADTTELSVINYLSLDAKPKMGYFITPKMHGEDAQEMWQKAWLTFDTLKNSGDFITLKYRTSRNFRFTFDQPGTWASTTTFTTTATEFSGVAVGDEIEVLSGEGSGMSANITAISGSGTYTVTIDTTLTGASGTFQFRVANWTKIDTVTDLISAYKDFSIGQPANWVQFKCLMYGTGGTTEALANSPEIEKLIVNSTPQIKAGA